MKGISHCLVLARYLIWYPAKSSSGGIAKNWIWYILSLCYYAWLVFVHDKCLMRKCVSLLCQLYRVAQYGHFILY